MQLLQPQKVILCTGKLELDVVWQQLPAAAVAADPHLDPMDASQWRLHVLDPLQRDYEEPGILQVQPVAACGQSESSIMMPVAKDCASGTFIEGDSLTLSMPSSLGSVPRPIQFLVTRLLKGVSAFLAGRA